MKKFGVILTTACICACTTMLTGCQIVDVIKDTAADPSCEDFETNRITVSLSDEEVYAEIGQPIKIPDVTAFAVMGIVDTDKGCYAMFDAEHSDDEFEELYFYILDSDGDPVYSNSHTMVGTKYRIGFMCDPPDTGEVVIESSMYPKVHVAYNEVIQKHESEAEDT